MTSQLFTVLSRTVASDDQRQYIQIILKLFNLIFVHFHRFFNPKVPEREERKGGDEMEVKKREDREGGRI